MPKKSTPSKYQRLRSILLKGRAPFSRDSDATATATASLLDDDDNDAGAGIRYKSPNATGAFWRDRSRRRRPKSSATEPLFLRLFAWIGIVLLTTLLGYQRLGSHFTHEYTLQQLWTAGVSNKLCEFPADVDRLCRENNQTASEAYYFYFYNSSNRQCWLQKPSLCQSLEKFFFSEQADCQSHCLISLAPFGAFLCIGSFGLSIVGVFSFICLPFDSDKARLRKSLFKWLCWDLLFLILVFLMAVPGALMVVLHDDESPWVRNTRGWKEKLVWDVALLTSPFLVLSYHVSFWRYALSIYRSIDTSKQVLRGVWSTTV